MNNSKIEKAIVQINMAIDILWDEAYTYGPSMESWTGNEWIASSDIVQRVNDAELDKCIKFLQDAKDKLEHIT